MRSLGGGGASIRRAAEDAKEPGPSCKQRRRDAPSMSRIYLDHAGQRDLRRYRPMAIRRRLVSVSGRSKSQVPYAGQRAPVCGRRGRTLLHRHSHSHSTVLSSVNSLSAFSILYPGTGGSTSDATSLSVKDSKAGQLSKTINHDKDPPLASVGSLEKPDLHRCLFRLFTVGCADE